jgi:hypothetical protein
MADSSGHSNNLTNTNATYTNIAGLLPNTLTFNGSTTTSAAANYTNTNFTGSTPFSVCAWANQTSGPAARQGWWAPLTGPTDQGWGVFLQAGSPNNRFDVLLANSSTGWFCASQRELHLRSNHGDGVSLLCDYRRHGKGRGHDCLCVNGVRNGAINTVLDNLTPVRLPTPFP